MLPYLMYMECTNCKNFFFIYEEIESPLEHCDVQFCPYCGTKFEYEMEF
jgi:hypothetical protein